MSVTIGYPDSKESIAVNLIASWDRDKLPVPTEAPTLRNMALALFDADPAIVRVVFVSTGRAFFFLVQTRDRCWFDTTGRQIELKQTSDTTRPAREARATAEDCSTKKEDSK